MKALSIDLLSPIHRSRFAALLIVVLYLSSIAQLSASTSYVSFNDGCVYVFPDTCIVGITTTEESVVITAADGKHFIYPMSSVASISQTPPRELASITSYKFNNKYNYQIFTDVEGAITDGRISAQVAGIGKSLTASFQLSDEGARLYLGETELISKKSRLRYDTTQVLTACYPGDRILFQGESGTCFFKPFGREYAVDVTFLTDLAATVPRIDINTVGGENISSKEYYLDAEIIIDGKGVFPSMSDSVKVKGRGNDSWSSNPNAKNPYRLKFSSKVKPLGLAKGKNWVLLANKIQGSMLTGAYGMKAASLIGTVAANHIIPVDLYVNGKYKGSYNFTEKVGLSGNSVDIDSDTVATLLELDTYYDEAAGQKFKSSPYNLPVNIKDPEFGVDETLLTLGLIQKRFNDFVSTVRAGGNLETQVDIDCLARYLFTNELLFNKEIFHPKSTYCYNENVLDNNSLFVFGPVWDLDWAMGFSGSNGASYFKNNVKADFYSITMTQSAFFRALRYDDKVSRRIYEVCRDFVKNDLDELLDFCGDYYLYAKPSLERNRTAAVDSTNYALQSLSAADWFKTRTAYIYKSFRLEQDLLGDVNGDDQVTIADLTYLIDYLMCGNRTLLGDLDADLDNDDIVSLSDLTFLIDILLGMNSDDGM